MRHFQDTWSHASEFSNIIDVIIPSDVMLPCQMPSSRAAIPEAALLSAVYRNALWRLENSYMRPRHKSLRERCEVLSWIHGDPAGVSFEMVCAHFDVEPEILRAAIVAWCRDMEHGKFRPVVVRQSPAKGNSNHMRVRSRHYVKNSERRQASLEVRP